MLLPLDFSMSLWWVATPEWGAEPEPSIDVALAASADGVSRPVSLPVSLLLSLPLPLLIGDMTSLNSTTLGAPAQVKPAPARAPRALVVTGYHWTAEVDWKPSRGALWEGLQHARRHDADRHRDDRSHAPHHAGPP
jgi:hypothetical protein